MHYDKVNEAEALKRYKDKERTQYKESDDEKAIYEGGSP
jgi:hypothetical protein